MERADSEPTLEEPAQLEPALAPEDAAPGPAGERARTDSEVEALRDGDGDDAPRLGFEAAATGVEWREGDAVEVFYRTLEDGNGGYFRRRRPATASDQRAHGLLGARRRRARLPGLARRARRRAPHARALARRPGPAARHAREANAVQRRARPACGRAGLGFPSRTRASLGLVLVRWGGEEQPESCDGTHAGGWGPSGAVPSHTYAAGLMEAIHGRVGEFVEAVGEVRAYCVDGKLEKLLYTRFDDPDAGDEPVGEEDQGRFVTFSELERADAVQQWFRGDEAPRAPRSARSGRSSAAGSRGSGLGASFLGWRDGPRLVFDALLRSCFRDRPCEGGAYPLPAWVERDLGDGRKRDAQAEDARVRATARRRSGCP
ncbi:hypothetical protein JL720_11544 [Aureococcus anophagefferens]|nr:hypothetical protein JL720_11544 [Aureococcus anophagefferens]